MWQRTRSYVNMDVGQNLKSIQSCLLYTSPSIFEDYDRERAVDTCEGIAMQFTKSKGYLTVQATEEGYFYIFYDSDLHEINESDYDNPDISIQKATYEILKSERTVSYTHLDVYKRQLLSNGQQRSDTAKHR